MVFDLVSKHRPFIGADSIVTPQEDGTVAKRYINLVQNLQVLKTFRANGLSSLDYNDACTCASEILDYYREDTLKAAKKLEATKLTEIIDVDDEKYSLHAQVVPNGTEKSIDKEGIPTLSGQKFVEAEIFKPYDGNKYFDMDLKSYSNSGLRAKLESFIKRAFDAANFKSNFELDLVNVKIKVDKATKKVKFFFTDLASSLFCSYRDIVKSF